MKNDLLFNCSGKCQDGAWRCRGTIALALVWLTGASGVSLRAGLMITEPQTRAVFQRDGDGMAILRVVGVCDSEELARVEVRAVPMPDFSGTEVEWQVLENVPGGEEFVLELPLAQGWYRVEVRSTQASEQNEIAVERVGVGDVFITAGQSNAANFGQSRGTPEDDRVSAWGPGGWQLAVDPQPLANGSGGTPWPLLGDLLADSLDTPVGFVSVGRGATRVFEWLPGGELYEGLRDALEFLGPGGLRAVLWHQGESDNNAKTTTELYVERLEAVIAASRVDAGFDLPWGVARASFVPGNEPPAAERVIAAQEQVIAADPLVFAGPATDELVGEEWRFDGLHFNEAGLERHAQLWFESLEAFPDIEPPPKEIPPTAVILLSSSTLMPLDELEASAAESTAQPDHVIVEFSWDFGDSAELLGETVLHEYETPGKYTIRLTVTDDRGLTGSAEAVVSVAEPAGTSFIRGNCDGVDGAALDLTDAVFLLRITFVSRGKAPCTAACDANGDGEVSGSVADAVFILRFAFLGGNPPAPPYPVCGEGSEADITLGCDEAPNDCVVDEVE